MRRLFLACTALLALSIPPMFIARSSAQASTIRVEIVHPTVPPWCCESGPAVPKDKILYTCTDICPPESKPKKHSTPWKVCGSPKASKPPHCVPRGVRVVHLKNGKVKWIWPAHHCGGFTTTKAGTCTYQLVTSYCDEGLTASGDNVFAGEAAIGYEYSLGTRGYVPGYGRFVGLDREGFQPYNHIDLWSADCGWSDNWGAEYGHPVYIFR